MSRSYEMGIVVADFDPIKRSEIEDACNLEWSFDDWYEHDGRLSANGLGSLCGGESDDQFSHRLNEAIVKANGGPCGVEVIATYMENLPFERYTFGEDLYPRTDWQYEVSNGDTKLGYADWCEHKKEADDES